MDKVRFGVVGLGGMGSHHVGYFPRLQRAVLTALCDSKPERLARHKHLGLPTFERYEDLLASGLVDAVLIATPHYDHPPITRAALERKIHVLSEKPVAVTVGEARKTNELYARHPDLKYAVMFQTRTVARYRKMREMIASGELGEVTRITWIATNWFRTWTYYASGGWRATWAGEGGGVLINQNPHNLDLLQWIPNLMPRRVTAVAAIAKTHPIEVEDEVSAVLEYDNGAIGHFITSSGEAPGTDRLEIAGDRGKLISEEGKLRFVRTTASVRQVREHSPESFANVETWDINIPCDSSRPEGHQAITQNFVNAILNGEPLIAPGVEGVRGLEIGNAMLMAGVTRQPVELPLDAEAYEQLLEDLKKKYGGRKSLQARTGTTADLAGSFVK